MHIGRMRDWLAPTASIHIDWQTSNLDGLRFLNLLRMAFRFTAPNALKSQSSKEVRAFRISSHTLNSLDFASTALRDIMARLNHRVRLAVQQNPTQRLMQN
jgi:hypothetical protein